MVVLDALDECDDSDDIRLLLRVLGNSENMLSLGFRLLITSRPESPIRLGFQDMKDITYHELALHDVPRPVVDRDIKILVTHKVRPNQSGRKIVGLLAGR